MANAPVAQPKSTPPGKPTLIPPEEQFWIRYSPHNEAPLSGVTSVVLHALAVLLAVLLVWIASKLRSDDENRSLPVDTVTFGGGGGDRKGVGDGPGGGKAGEDNPMEKGEPGGETGTEPPPPPEPIKLPVAQLNKVAGEYDNDPAIKRIIRRGNKEAEKLFKLPEAIRKQLRRSVNPGAGQGGSGAGRGGSGSGGGRDKGTDKGDGPGQGKGQGKLSKREKRVLRWSMLFNTANGRDYLNQLHGLGAIIALPRGDRFKVIRDLNNPGAARIEDVSGIKRIYWIDEKPQSVQSLCTALRQEIPTYFVAFFPLKLEQRLLDLELAALKRLDPRATEDDIDLTKFDVINRGGEYDVRVKRVTLRRR